MGLTIHRDLSRGLGVFAVIVGDPQGHRVRPDFVALRVEAAECHGVGAFTVANYPVAEVPFKAVNPTIGVTRV